VSDFDHREQELLCQIEELQIDVHRLNNRIDPILPQALVEEEAPNVLIAEDNGMEVDPEVQPEEEEEEDIEPFEDDHSDGVFDVDSDHSEA
jgi:hypothetical protein